MPMPLAHSGGHLLEDHLRAVAKLAALFSAEFDPDSGSSQSAVPMTAANCEIGFDWHQCKI